MNGPIDGLLSTLHLTDTGARTTEDIFTGPSQWMPLGRVFGGQVLAQSLVAAMHTVPERPDHPLDARVLPATGRRAASDHLLGRPHPRRPFVHDPAHAGLPERRADPLAHRLVPDSATAASSTRSTCPTDLPEPESLPIDGRRARRPRPRRRPLLVERTRIRRAPHPLSPLPPRRRRPCAASGGVDEGLRPPARRPQPASGRTRLRERLLDPRAARFGRTASRGRRLD